MATAVETNGAAHAHDSGDVRGLTKSQLPLRIVDHVGGKKAIVWDQIVESMSFHEVEGEIEHDDWSSGQRVTRKVKQTVSALKRTPTRIEFRVVIESDQHSNQFPLKVSQLMAMYFDLERSVATLQAENEELAAQLVAAQREAERMTNVAAGLRGEVEANKKRGKA